MEPAASRQTYGIPTSLRWLIVFAASLLGGLAVKAWIEDSEPEELLGFLAITFLLLWLAWLAWVRVLVTEDGLEQRTLLGAGQRISWGELSEIRFNRLETRLELVGRCGRVSVSILAHDLLEVIKRAKKERPDLFESDQREFRRRAGLAHVLLLLGGVAGIILGLVMDSTEVEWWERGILCVGGLFTVLCAVMPRERHLLVEPDRLRFIRRSAEIQLTQEDVSSVAFVSVPVGLNLEMLSLQLHLANGEKRMLEFYGGELFSLYCALRAWQLAALPRRSD
ncbi:hypothetical protein [Cerasicoccus maritimus]|uniref:hypothetical protein n=1 Tax=Cerasicoccus maritimus TaxID=490089 RepID=UPI0028525227|nr:hypothetical protein [Cerasicoccus maritimus]